LTGGRACQAFNFRFSLPDKGFFRGDIALFTVKKAVKSQNNKNKNTVNLNSAKGKNNEYKINLLRNLGVSPDFFSHTYWMCTEE
jgi:hypothetical protein